MALVGSCTVTSIAPACADQAHEFSNRNAFLLDARHGKFARAQVTVQRILLRTEMQPMLRFAAANLMARRILVVPKRSYSA